MNWSRRIKDIKDNPFLLTFYAKSSCKKCFGRGYITINSVETGEDSNIICTCVKRSLEKEIKNGENS